MVMWCENCETYFATSRKEFRWMCPVCKSYTSVMRCNRCGHKWRPRMGRVPQSCPHCDSQYWNRQRILPPSNGEEGEE